MPLPSQLTSAENLVKGDWYTMYLSKGLTQEGETAAQYLNKQKKGPERAVVQVFRDNLAGLTLSKAFQEAWTGLGNKPPENKILQGQEVFSAPDLKEIGELGRPVTMVLWLGGEDFPDLTSLAKQDGKYTVMASATQLGKTLYTLPEAIRPLLSLTYPYSLPKESIGFRSRADPTLSAEKLPAVQREPALKLYSVYQVLSGSLSNLRTFVHRDYFMELLESAPDLASTPVFYPRLSFGQGQRYASKGCYVVELSLGNKPKLIKKTEWITH